MEQVDKALLISLGIKGTKINTDVEVEAHEVDKEPQETLSIFQSMGQQLRFWQDIGVKVSLIKNEISRLDDEINSVLNYIEETNYNAAQGYKVYKVLRDKQVERKALVKEVICLESIIAHMDTEQLVKAFQDSIKLSDEKIREANKITFVKELMEETI